MEGQWKGRWKGRFVLGFIYGILLLPKGSLTTLSIGKDGSVPIDIKGGLYPIGVTGVRTGGRLRQLSLWETSRRHKEWFVVRGSWFVVRGSFCSK